LLLVFSSLIPFFVKCFFFFENLFVFFGLCVVLYSVLKKKECSYIGSGDFFFWLTFVFLGRVMAKFGEGDKRWIVEERADGTNVHNWHWAEKDCLPWSRKRLAQLLENIDILTGEGGLWITTRNVEVEGEAYVNIRKGKIIPGYEISVRLGWTGEAKDGNGNSLIKVQGNVDLPYVADENANDEPELKVSVRDESALGQRLREAFLVKGKPIVLEKIARYVKDIAAGGPAKDELESVGKATKSSNGSKPGKAVAAAAASEIAKPAASTAPAPKPTVREGFKTITLTEKFHCRPADLYSVLLDEKRWRGFTQSAAKISTEEGGTFSIFDGAVTGVNLQLQEDKLITQRWRFSSWTDGHYSNVRFFLSPFYLLITLR
jgi:activator of HSP90 ATPase